MKNSTIKSLVIASAILMATSSVHAATKGRVIPNGSVSFQKNGTVAKYSVQTPLDDNALITCNENCMIKLQGLTLAAADQTTFAVKKINGLLNIYVETGLVNFTLTNTSQQMAFYTRGGQYVKTEGFLVPASTSSAVAGYMKVTDSGAVVGMDNGSMVLSTADGVTTVNSGNAFQLALAEVPGAGATGAAAGAGAGAGAGTGAAAGAGAGAGAAGAGAAAGAAAAGGIAGVSTAVIVGGTIVAAAVVGGTVVVVNNNKDDDEPASLNQ